MRSTALLRPLLLISLLAGACHHYRGARREVIPPEALEDLQMQAAEAFRCPEDRLETRPLTLLMREVIGCGHGAVYAWDPLHDLWVVTSVEKG